MNTAPSFLTVLGPRFFVFIAGLLFTGHGLATDSDGDGIPADWENFRGTSDSDASDALMDFDGDGLNTFQEYLTQGRPWGNYSFRRLPFSSLPVTLPVSSVGWTEFIAVNRAGEFVISFHGTSGSRTFLWTPPGGTLSSPELIEVPYLGSPAALLNDSGEVFVPAAGGGREIRSLRNWNAGSVPFYWTGVDNPVPLALSNDQRVLLWTHTLGSSSEQINLYQWCDAGGGWSGQQTFTFNPGFENHSFGVAADTISGAWLFGLSFDASDPPGIMDAMTVQLPEEGNPGPLGPFSGYTGLSLEAAANGRAVGVAMNTSSGNEESGMVDVAGWQTISGGAAGFGPLLTAVADDGTVLGWNLTVEPAEPFLWRESAVILNKARPEMEGGIAVTGMAANGTLYGLDYGNYSLPPQPVALPSALPHIGDGAADEGGSLTDTDRDGIPDAKEAGTGTSAQAADSDGDGWADLWEMVSLRAANYAEPSGTTPGSHAGLEVYTPASHALRRPSLPLP